MSFSIRRQDSVIVVLALLIVGLVATGVAVQADVIYVDRSATNGANNGSSWADAYTDLQTALGTATSGDQIWVAKGVYTPGTTQVSSFALKDGVGLYGGYPAGGGTRDVAANVTVLSGDIDHNDTKDTDGVTTTISGKNASHVVTTNGNNSTAILDGFTITGGNANGSSPKGRGGGMLNYSSSPDVTNCTFSGNSANGSSGDGGGMYNYSSSPTVTNCTFSGNSAYGGSGMYNYSSSPTVTNCTFSGNSADVGGGILNSENSNARIYNTILWGNSGKEILNDDSKPTVSDCVIEDGYADGTNIITADPKLGTLGDYGGPTETIPIETGSSAIDAAVYQSDVTQPTTDQRGIPRPQGRACDIGAYEAP